MSIFGEFHHKIGFFESLCYKVMQMGKIPKHIGVIMDGNRRYAKKENISRKAGHSAGFETLAHLLHWCFELGIPEVTCYAFSIENFKRTKEEVDTLIGIFNEKLNQLFKEKDLLMKYGVCIRFVGDISLFKPHIRKSVAEAMELTKDNNKSFLNIGMGYTTRDEIAQAICETALGVQEGLIRESDITESLLEGCFYTNKSQPVDMLIRTSGEVRLSDFLLWQTSFSILCFVDVYWPDFSLWHFCYCILKYQLGYETLENAKELTKLKQNRALMDSDLKCAYAELRESHKRDSPELFDMSLKEYTEKREERQRNFLKHVEDKRQKLLQQWLKGE